MVEVGETYRMGNRVFIVTRVVDGVVTYLDCYEDGAKVRRIGSEVQWTVDEARGDLARIESESEPFAMLANEEDDGEVERLAEGLCEWCMRPDIDEDALRE